MTEVIKQQTDQQGVCTVTLNRPERHNALNPAMIQALTVALQNAAADDAVRVVIITGVGDSFSSGADLDWMRAAVDVSEADNRRDAQQLSDLMRVLYDLPKPSIARVNGSAFGGGIGVIACCDIAVTVEAAQFAFTEVRLGLAPAVISPYILMSMGPRQARRLFLTAERFSSRDALTFELVHEVTTMAELDSAVEKQVKRLLQAGPEAIKACKALLPRLSNAEIDAELVAMIAALRVSPEGQEGLRAFLDKRPPNWVKRS